MMTALVMPGETVLCRGPSTGDCLDLPLRDANGNRLTVARNETIFAIERKRTVHLTHRWTVLRVIDLRLRIGWIWFSTDEFERQTNDRARVPPRWDR